MIATQGKYGLYPGIMGDISTDQYWADWYEEHGTWAKKRHRINNHQAGGYAKDLELFQGSNLHSEINPNGWYMVLSYEWYPILAWSNETGWIGVLESYSNSTRRHINQAGMHGVPLYTSGVLRWMTDIDPGLLPKPPKETGKHYLSIDAKVKVNEYSTEGYRIVAPKPRWAAQVHESKWFELFRIHDSHHYYPMLETQHGYSTELPTHRRKSAQGMLAPQHYTDIKEQVEAVCHDMYGVENRVNMQINWMVNKHRIKQGATNDEEKNTHKPACDTQGQSDRGKEPLHHGQDV